MLVLLANRQLALLHMLGGYAIATRQPHLYKGRKIIAAFEHTAVNCMEARLVILVANLFNTRMYYLADNANTIGKFILRIIQNILMPGIRQERQDLFSYHTLFHTLNQLIKARYTAFDR